MSLDSQTQLYTLGTDTLEKVSQTVVANIGVILPVALTLFGIVFSIKFIPQLLKKFSK